MSKFWLGSLFGFMVSMILIGGFLWNLVLTQNKTQEESLYGECGFMVMNPESNETWFNVISGDGVTVKDCGYASMLFNKYSSVQAMVVDEYPTKVYCSRENIDGTIDSITGDAEIAEAVCERVKETGYR